jgi:predicted nucleic acid-binding protein
VRGFLLDTNVISELRRPRPAAAVVGFVAAQPEETLFVSEVTFAEIRFGIAQVGDPERRAVLAAWLARTLRPLFEGRTLALNEDVLLRWRLLLEAGCDRGHTFGQLDLFIAATAAEEELIVVSRDATHFLAAGVAILDPWTGIYVTGAGCQLAVADLGSPDLLVELAALGSS